MTLHDARQEAASLLKDEANSLACILGDKKWEDLPHRAKVAIRREMERFRKIEEILRGELNP